MRRADIRFNSDVGCGGTGIQGGAQADPDGLRHAGVCPVGFTRLDVVTSEHGLVTCMKDTTSRWLGAARGVEGGRTGCRSARQACCLGTWQCLGKPGQGTRSRVNWHHVESCRRRPRCEGSHWSNGATAPDKRRQRPRPSPHAAGSGRWAADGWGGWGAVEVPEPTPTKHGTQFIFILTRS
jgi:hypothetical protein